MRDFLERLDDAETRWRYVAVLVYRGEIDIADLPDEAARIMSFTVSRPSLDALGATYRNESSDRIRALYAGAREETGVALPSRAEAVRLAARALVESELTESQVMRALAHLYDLAEDDYTEIDGLSLEASDLLEYEEAYHVKALPQLYAELLAEVGRMPGSLSEQIHRATTA